MIDLPQADDGGERRAEPSAPQSGAKAKPREGTAGVRYGVMNWIAQFRYRPPVTPAPGEFVIAPPLYGVWIYDPRDQTQRVIVPGEEGFMFTEVVSGDPRPFPAVIPDGLNYFADDPSLPTNHDWRRTRQ